MSETKKIIDTVVYFAKDTEDPIEGTVFEKTVEIDFANFCAFVFTQFDNVTMEIKTEEKTTVYLFYTNVSDHIASYITGKKAHGCFGGMRVGSNDCCNGTGKSFVVHAFTPREVTA